MHLEQWHQLKLLGREAKGLLGLRLSEWGMRDIRGLVLLVLVVLSPV